MADTTNVDLSFLARMSETILKELRDMRREHNDFRTIILGLSDQARRTDHKIADLSRQLSEVVPDMELMIKGEIMGRFARYDGQVDDKMEALVTRMMDLFEPKKSNT